MHDTATHRCGTRLAFDQAVAFRADPDAALRGLREPVLLDDWQAVPGVLGAVRRAVEADPGPNRFFPTGSVRAELDNEPWPGTGRIVRVAMHPMTVRERTGRLGPTTFLDALVAALIATAQRIGVQGVLADGDLA